MDNIIHIHELHVYVVTLYVLIQYQPNHFYISACIVYINTHAHTLLTHTHTHSHTAYTYISLYFTKF